jgi:hypothetical protein
MRAASEQSATGTAPLPSQSGRDRPFNAFKTQRGLLGSSSPQPFPPAEATPPMPIPPPMTAPAPPVAQQTLPTEPPPENTEKAEPAPAPPAPPTDLRTVDKPRNDEIALTAKSSTPPQPSAITEIKPFTPRPIRGVMPRPLDDQAMLTTPPPKPQPPRESGYQPEQEANRIEGSISNRGRSAVDAVGTPMGKFRKRVNDAIGSRWQAYVKDPRRSSLFGLGSTRVTFFITSEGRVQGVKVDANSANQSFADICVAAISDAQRNDAEIFQPPPGALEAMRDGRLEYSITFTLYSY